MAEWHHSIVIAWHGAIRSIKYIFKVFLVQKHVQHVSKASTKHGSTLKSSPMFSLTRSNGSTALLLKLGTNGSGRNAIADHLAINDARGLSFLPSNVSDSDLLKYLKRLPKVRMDVFCPTDNTSLRPNSAGVDMVRHIGFRAFRRFQEKLSSCFMGYS